MTTGFVSVADCRAELDEELGRPRPAIALAFGGALLFFIGASGWLAFGAIRMVTAW